MKVAEKNISSLISFLTLFLSFPLFSLSLSLSLSHSLTLSLSLVDCDYVVSQPFSVSNAPCLFSVAAVVSEPVHTAHLHFTFRS